MINLVKGAAWVFQRATSVELDLSDETLTYLGHQALHFAVKTEATNLKIALMAKHMMPLCVVPSELTPGIHLSYLKGLANDYIAMMTQGVN